MRGSSVLERQLARLRVIHDSAARVIAHGHGGSIVTPGSETGASRTVQQDARQLGGGSDHGVMARLELHHPDTAAGQPRAIPKTAVRHAKANGIDGGEGGSVSYTH